MSIDEIISKSYKKIRIKKNSTKKNKYKQFDTSGTKSYILVVKEIDTKFDTLTTNIQQQFNMPKNRDMIDIDTIRAIEHLIVELKINLEANSYQYPTKFDKTSYYCIFCNMIMTKKKTYQ